MRTGHFTAVMSPPAHWENARPTAQRKWLLVRAVVVAAATAACAAPSAVSTAQSVGAGTGRTTHLSLSARDIGLLRDSVRFVLDRARADSAFPGAIAVIGTHDSVIVDYGVGSLDWAPSPRPDDNTLWDMASLTKVVGMTSANRLPVIRYDQWYS